MIDQTLTVLCWYELNDSHSGLSLPRWYQFNNLKSGGPLAQIWFSAAKAAKVNIIKIMTWPVNLLIELLQIQLSKRVTNSATAVLRRNRKTQHQKAAHGHGTTSSTLHLCGLILKIQTRKTCQHFVTLQLLRHSSFSLLRSREDLSSQRPRLERQGPISRRCSPTPQRVVWRSLGTLPQKQHICLAWSKWVEPLDIWKMTRSWRFRSWRPRSSGATYSAELPLPS